MHEHQRAPLPLEQLKGLPQPVVVLLEVMLEKDAAQRFQSPAQLLKAVPLVAAAINAGRSVSPQDLKAISGEGAFQKSGKFSDPLKAFFRSSRVRLLAWLVSVLLIGGVVIILTVNLVNHPAAKFPVTPPVSIEAPEKSIAVLPFENISANKDDVYFADGVQDEILNNLTGNLRFQFWRDSGVASPVACFELTRTLSYRPTGSFLRITYGWRVNLELPLFSNRAVLHYDDLA
jgi:hypothetical protein